MASGQSRQREALRPLERLVEALKEAMVARQHEEGGAGQLRVLHSVLAQFAAADGAQSDQPSLHECAEAVAAAIFGWLEGLNEAVRLERAERGVRSGTIPMPVLGLWSLEKAVELTHCFVFFPLLSPAVRRAVPFASALTPREGKAQDTTPYGDIVALTRGAAAVTPAPELFAAAERSAALLVTASEELHPALHTVRHLATLYAALLEQCYHPDARATAGGAAAAARCREIWQALSAALPAQLRTDALLALQAASAAPSSAASASVSSRRQAGVGRAPPWFVKAVRFSLSVVTAGEGGVQAMLGSVLGTDHADDDRCATPHAGPSAAAISAVSGAQGGRCRGVDRWRLRGATQAARPPRGSLHPLRGQAVRPPTPYSRSVRVQLCHARGCFGLQAGAAAELRARRLGRDVRHRPERCRGCRHRRRSLGGRRRCDAERRGGGVEEGRGAHGLDCAAQRAAAAGARGDYAARDGAARAVALRPPGCGS